MDPKQPLPAAIGPYPVVRVVAAGGMAVVYEVTDPESGRPLAVKVLQSKSAGAPRFAREYRALTRIDHPNVVRVYRYAISETGLPYLVMELLHGAAAQVRVKATGRPGDPVRTAEAIRIAFHVAEALRCLHDRGIIHRDLKSSNVIALPDGTVKVLDFGTARMEHLREALTEPGEFVGSFHYASPEQLCGGRVDARTDLYALGVLLYRMLSGRRPFEGEDATTLARQHLEFQPPPIEGIVRGVPAPIGELVKRLLAKSASERPRDAGVVADFLRPFVVSTSPWQDDPLPTLRFVGRNSHTSAIRQLFDEAKTGASLIFCGPEGSGRGRLVGFAVDEATRRGIRSINLLASGTAHPFIAVCQMLERGLLTDGDEEGAAHAARALTPDGVDPEALALALSARARLDRQTVLFAMDGLEDAMEAHVTMAARTMVAMTGLEGRVVLVGAWSEEALPTPWDSARLMTVRPLTGLDVAVVASLWLGVTTVPPELVRRLTAASGGMPAPLEALVRTLPRGSAAAAKAPGQPGDAHHLPLPASVREGLIMRVESLPGSQRRVLEALALAEGDLDLAVVAFAVDLAAPVVLTLIGDLLREQLLDAVPTGWVFRQGMAADFVRERTRNTRRALLCRRIAQALPNPPPSHRLPLVLLEADRPGAAARSVVAWARPLVDAGLYTEALIGLEKVVQWRPQAPEDFALWRLYAECTAVLRSAGMKSEQALEQARALALNAVEEGEVALVGAEVARAKGDTPEERACLAQAVETFRRAGEQEPTHHEAEASARLADLLGCIGEFDAAQRLARAGLDTRLAALQTASSPPEAAGPDLAGLSRSRTALGWVELQRGDIASAERIFVETIGGGGSDWRAVSGLATAMRVQGRLSEARRLLDQTLMHARIHAPAPLLATVLVAAAQVDIDLFRAGLARDRFHQAMDAVQGCPPPALDAPLALLRARLLDLSGDAQGGLQTVEPALARAEARGWGFHAALLTAQRGVLLRRVGRDGEAMSAAAVRMLVQMGALFSLSEVLVAAVDRGESVTPLLRSEVETWAKRQPVRIARLALLTDDLRRSQDAGETDRELTRTSAQSLLRELTELQGPEDRAGFLLHPRRQNLRAGRV